MRHLFLAAIAALFALGCGVSHPPGWSARSAQSTQVRPGELALTCSGDTSLVGPGVATVGAAVGSQGPSLSTSSTVLIGKFCEAFTIADRSSNSVRCAYGAETNGWFRCHAVGGAEGVLELGADAACSPDLHGPDAAATLQTQGCWEGTATLGGVAYRLHRGSLLAREEVAWTVGDGDLVFAADVAQYPPKFFGTAGGPAPDPRHAMLLQLMTTAIAYLEAARTEQRRLLDDATFRRD